MLRTAYMIHSKATSMIHTSHRLVEILQCVCLIYPWTLSSGKVLFLETNDKYWKSLPEHNPIILWLPSSLDTVQVRHCVQIAYVFSFLLRPLISALFMSLMQNVSIDVAFFRVCGAILHELDWRKVRLSPESRSQEQTVSNRPFLTYLGVHLPRWGMLAIQMVSFYTLYLI